MMNTTSGKGIQFLPGDIKGLSTKLNLLLAEFTAGNMSLTWDKIVYILDERLRWKADITCRHGHLKLNGRRSKKCDEK